jgi:hypothetical protein
MRGALGEQLAWRYETKRSAHAEPFKLDRID